MPSCSCQRSFVLLADSFQPLLQPMHQVWSTLLNSAIYGISQNLITCPLHMLSSLHSLPSTSVSKVVQLSKPGYLASTVGILSIMHLGTAMINGYTFAIQLPPVKAPPMKNLHILQCLSTTSMCFNKHLTSPSLSMLQSGQLLLSPSSVATAWERLLSSISPPKILLLMSCAPLIPFSTPYLIKCISWTSTSLGQRPPGKRVPMSSSQHVPTAYAYVWQCLITSWLTTTFRCRNCFSPNELLHGCHHPLTKQDFLSFINKIWSNAGLLHINGHSFRIGGAIEFLLAPEVVIAIRGWTSLAFLLYWHHLKEILPMSTACAYKRQEIDHLSQIFEEFHIQNDILKDFLNSFNDISIL